MSKLMTYQLVRLCLISQDDASLVKLLFTPTNHYSGAFSTADCLFQQRSQRRMTKSDVDKIMVAKLSMSESQTITVASHIGCLASVYNNCFILHRLDMQ
jgi:hypothetical protein